MLHHRRIGSVLNFTRLMKMPLRLNSSSSRSQYCFGTLLVALRCAAHDSDEQHCQQRNDHNYNDAEHDPLDHNFPLRMMRTLRFALSPTWRYQRLSLMCLAAWPYRPATMAAIVDVNRLNPVAPRL